MMCGVDREILAGWAAHGVPYDKATCRNASTVIAAVLAELEEWQHIAVQLGDLDDVDLDRLRRALTDIAGEEAQCG